MSNSIKACLISIGPPELAAKLKCYMKLMCHGKGIFHKLRRQDFNCLPLCWQVYNITFCGIVHIWLIPSLMLINVVYEWPKEIISYNGNVFSIDETKNLHKWDSGGLIYPADIIGRVTFIPNGIKILVSVDKGPSIYYVIIFLRFLTPFRSLSQPQIIS